MEHEHAKQLIETQFKSGPLKPLEDRALRAHVRSCDECKTHYDQIARIERALDGEVVPEALVARTLARGPSREAKPSTRRVRTFALPLSLLAAAAAVLVAFLLVRPQDPSSAFTPRKVGPEGRTAWLKVYRAREEKIEPLGESLKQGDGLLFAYTNLKNSHARYLVIFGLDGAGRAHWYHPAYKSEADRPVSIGIDAGVANIELKERVFAEHAKGKLRICGVFSKDQLSVRALDEVLEKTRSVPVVGALDCREVEVVE